MSKNRIPLLLRTILFLCAYSPLLAILIISQIDANYDKLFTWELSLSGFANFLRFFGISILASIAILVGILGIVKIFRNIEETTRTNGQFARVSSISSKSSETINYISTYIVPFLFEDLSSSKEVLSLIILLIIIYRIYVSSNLILINPLLGFFYNINEVEISKAGSTVCRRAILISRDEFEPDDDIVTYDLTSSIFFAIKKIEQTKAQTT